MSSLPHHLCQFTPQRHRKSLSSQNPPPWRAHICHLTQRHPSPTMGTPCSRLNFHPCELSTMPLRLYYANDCYHRPPADYLGLNYSPGYPPPSSAHSLSSQYSRPSPPMSDPGMMYPVQAPQILSSGSSAGQEASHVRVVQSRPKPQCWEHGCNGRQFSTFSNLLRHQREKSGQAAKATCPNCGAEFTRTTVCSKPSLLIESPANLYSRLVMDICFTTSASKDETRKI